MKTDILNFINGAFKPSRSGESLDVYEPATGEVYAQLARSGAADVDDAVSAANKAFQGWSALPPSERSALLNRLADVIEDRFDEFAEQESRDTGKPVSLARAVDIPRSISNLRFFAAAAMQFSSEAHPMADGAINYTLRRPLGPVVCISPWNLPLYLLTWKIAPALAAGNTVIAKPSEITPASAALLSEACQEAGLPEGVLNIINGKGHEAGRLLCEHPEIKAVSFTGSTQTGASIAQQLAPRFIKLSLEMGGKNPAIVFADADLEKAVDGVIRGAFSNQGQICLCGSRVLVEKSIYDSFRDRLLEKSASLTPADPSLADTQQGALVSREHHEKIVSHLEIARNEGGRLLCGGPVTLPGRCKNGWFVSPVWLEGLPNESRTNQEEIFGPVATLQPFEDESQAITLANQSEYGLAATVWTSDSSRSHRLSEQLDFGIVWVNCWMRRDLRTPFGGVKNSGIGREGGWEVMRFFTEPTNVCIEYEQ